MLVVKLISLPENDSEFILEAPHGKGALGKVIRPPSPLLDKSNNWKDFIQFGNKARVG